MEAPLTSTLSSNMNQWLVALKKVMKYTLVNEINENMVINYNTSWNNWTNLASLSSGTWYERQLDNPNNKALRLCRIVFWKVRSWQALPKLSNKVARHWHVVDDGWLVLVVGDEEVKADSMIDKRPCKPSLEDRASIYEVKDTHICLGKTISIKRS